MVGRAGASAERLLGRLEDEVMRCLSVAVAACIWSIHQNSGTTLARVCC